MPRPNLENLRRVVKEKNSSLTSANDETTAKGKTKTRKTTGKATTAPTLPPTPSQPTPSQPLQPPPPQPSQPHQLQPSPSQPPQPQRPRATPRPRPSVVRTPAPLPRRYVVLALIIVLLLSGLVVLYVRRGMRSDAPVSIQPARIGYVNTTHLNLREGPGTTYPVHVILLENTQVTYLDESREADGSTWVKVQVGAQEGWVDGKYLR